MMQSKKLGTFIGKAFIKRYQFSSSCFLKPIRPVFGNIIPFNKFPPHVSSLHRSLCVSSFTSQKIQYLFSSSTSHKNVKHEKDDEEEATEKLSLFQRYKKMLKQYWYVLLPVHMVTSPLWFGGFYYAAKSGIDIVPLLEYLSLPEYLIKPFRSSSLGHIAVASAFYKLATPARYMVTLGGTTVSVKYLTKRGLIKPVPSKEKIKSMIQNKLKKDSPDDK